ncbi:MAG: type IV pili methyl-accepting chemotaxis transducer N-terminal domain-containing protein, partial [Myxococcota bacterium]
MDTSHREPRPSDPSSLSHRFTFRYTIALVVLGLMIGSVFLSTIYITRKDSLSPAAINIAGRQRMLSQKIAMLSLELLHAEYDQEELRTRLSNAIALMERSNHGLVHGDQEVRLESLPEHSSLWYLYMAPPHALDARTQRFLEHARGWADTPPEERTASDKRLLYILKEANGELVVLLDRAVTLFQVESEQHLHAVQLTYLVLFVLALGGLLG